MDDEMVGAQGRRSAQFELVVLRGNTVLHRELCESELAASSVADAWCEVEDVTCEVRHLTEKRGDANPRSAAEA